MTYNIISTGSQGNAVIINGTILIDCGVPFKALKPYYKDLKIVLLTHIHNDHFNKSTIKALAKERPNLRFACCEWLANDCLKAGVKLHRLDILQIGCKANYKAFEVIPVKLYHNVSNCGYRIFQDGKKLFYATDTGSLEGVKAKDYDLYMVEANYTNEQMEQRIQDKQAQGIYPYEYEVMHNHLSKEKCDSFIYENIGDRGVYVYLHQHKERIKDEQ